MLWRCVRIRNLFFIHNNSYPECTSPPRATAAEDVILVHCSLYIVYVNIEINKSIIHFFFFLVT